MSERSKRTTWTALAIAVITLASNAVQYQTTRAKASSRDDALVRAFSTSVDALSTAQQVVESMRARVEHLERTCGRTLKSARPGAPAPAPPVIAMLEEDKAMGGEISGSSALGFLGDSSATMVLDQIARDHGWKR